MKPVKLRFKQGLTTNRIKVTFGVLISKGGKSVMGGVVVTDMTVNSHHAVTEMATRKQVMDAIKNLGCTVDEMECDPDMLTIDAPKGKLFSCIGSHCLCEPLVDHFNPKLKRSDAYSAILNDLSYGLEDCTDPDCSTCQ